jgi:hypothetical protein
MNDWCYQGDEPHMYEPEPGPAECYECGAGEDELSIVSGLTGQAWCSRECREATRRRDSYRKPIGEGTR